MLCPVMGIAIASWQNSVEGDRVHKIVKKILIYLGGAIVLLVAAGLIVPNFVDWNKYKAQLEDGVYAATGQTVRINGNVSLAIVPNLELSVSDVALMAAGASEIPFLTLDRLDLDLALLPLLTGQLEVQSITLQGAEMTLERYADGSANWDFLLGEGDGSVGDAASDADRLKISDFEIQDSSFHYIDAALGRDDHVTILSAIITAGSAVGPFQIDGDFVYRSIPLEIRIETGRIVRAIGFGVSVKAALNDQSPGLEFQGRMVLEGAASSAAGQLSLKGDSAARFIAALSEIAGVDYTPEIDLDQAFELSAPVVMTKARMSAEPLDVEIGSMVGSGAVIYQNQREPSLSVSFNLNSLKIEDWLLASPIRPAATERATRQVENSLLPINIDVSLGAIEYRGGIAQRAHFAGRYEDGIIAIDEASAILPGGSNISVGGTLGEEAGSDAFRGTISLSSDHFRTLAGWFGHEFPEVPQAQLVRFRLDSNLILGGDILHFGNLSGKLDGTEFEGDFRVNLGENPHFAIDLELGSLVLDDYRFNDPVPDDGQNDATLGWTAFKASFAESADALAAYNGTLKLDIKQLRVREALAQDVVVDVEFVEDKLKINALETDNFRGLRGGIDGELTYSIGTPRFDLGVDLDAQNISAFVRWAGLELPVDPLPLGAASLGGTIKGTLDDVEIDLNGEIAEATFAAKGALKGLSPVPASMNIELLLAHANHRDLMRSLEVALPLQGAGQALMVRANLQGAPDNLKFTSSGNALGGTFVAGGVVGDNAPGQPLSMQIEFNHPSSFAIANIVGMDLRPANDILGPFHFGGQIVGGNDIYRVDVEQLVLGPSTLSGEASVNRTGVRPYVSASLRIDRLPLDQFFEPPREGAAQAQFPGGQRWSQDPIDLALLKEWNASLSVSVDAIDYGEYHYLDAGFQGDLKDGVLTVGDFTGVLFGGRTNASLRFDVRGVPRGEMLFTIEEGSFESALRATTANSTATGKLSLRSEVSFEGNSQFHIISSLSGEVELWARQGVIRGVDIDRLSARLENISSMGDFFTLTGATVVEYNLPGIETPYQNIRATFTGSRGVFRAERVDAEVEGADIAGSAEIDLRQWTVNGAASIKLLRPQDAPEIGFTITGDISNPLRRYQTDALRNYMVQRMMRSLSAGATSSFGGLPFQIPGLGATAVPPGSSPSPASPGADQPPSAGSAIIQGILGLMQQRREQQPQPPADDDGEGGND
jgi:AsmA family/AsmA-like C-terminal region